MANSRVNCAVSYPDSVRYLYALGNELKSGAKFGLGRMQVLLKELGNPEAGQRFVHVAGTNGKGSTCAMLASVLQEAGLRTGLYTSPHLVAPTERIQINGRPVSEAEFAALFNDVHAGAERLVQQDAIDAHPSYFETVTAMGLLAFRGACDISVMEVGLGGRLDATNVITPELCIITPVAFDHEAFLGNTLAAIASEKAGILKAGVPVVLSRQTPDAESVLVERTRELTCPLMRTADAQIAMTAVSRFSSEFEFGGVPYNCPLAGAHQVENAIAAILAARVLGAEAGAIQRGLQNVRWPGRLEYVARDPDFVLDGAHNPAGARALAEYIRRFFGNQPVWMVYGAMRDKAIDEVAAQLFPLADRLIVTAPDFPRALRPEAILELYEHPNATTTRNLPEAISIARSAPPRTVVFFTGSLYLVGEARRLLVP